MGCLDEDTVAAFVASRLPSDELGRARLHAVACVSCHDAVSTAFTRSGIDPTSATALLAPASAAAPSRPMLEAGTTVGRYTVLALVGQGGMGEVYAAYDPRLDRRIALKLISGDRASSGTAQERLLREAQAIAKVSHPNVVVVHDAGPFGAQVFIAMEFVEGRTLAAWLVARERPWREILEAFLQAARGLSAAHAAGLVHRDFKPQNVMMTASGGARVMDFGLARRIGEAERPSDAVDSMLYGSPDGPPLTHTGDLLGTPLYMAPEQFIDGRIDARADQFSFCVALYWALFGVHPFGGSSLAELERGARGGALAAPVKRSTAPAWIEKAVTRGLSTDPAARWPSIDALIDALTRDPRRRWRRGGLIAGALALVLVAGLSVAQLSRRARTLCAGGPARLGGVWELEGAGAGSRREAVRAAILTSGTAEPGKTWERVASLLDRHAVQWLGAYRETCEATAVRGEQSDAMLDLRMACLADNLESTRALTSLLSGGDRAIIDHAVEASGALEDLGRCADVQQLRAGIRPPRDPMVRAAVATLETTLKEGQVLFQAGQPLRAIGVADRVIADPASVDYCPLRAEALLLKGVSSSYESSRGRESLESAVVTAESCGADRVVAAAAAQLVYSLGGNDPAAAQHSAELARAALKRIGGDARIEGWLANNLGAAYTWSGRLDEARAQLEHAVEVKKRLLGPDHLDVGISLDTLTVVMIQLGRYGEAMAESDEVQAIGRKWADEQSFFVATSLDNRGDLFFAMGRLDEARAAYERSARTFDVILRGPDRFLPTIGLGNVALAREDWAAAAAAFERPVRAYETDRGNGKDMAEARFGLARALEGGHRDPGRARTLAKSALTFYASMPGFEKRRAEVQRWLDKKG